MGIDARGESRSPESGIAVPDHIPLAERLRIFRRLRGLTQRDLAGRVKRSERWMVSVEGNPAQLRLADLFDLARALDVSFEDLTGPASPPIPAGIGATPRTVVPNAPTAEYADLSAVYSTRSAFTAHAPLDDLFAQARLIRAAGISLNVLCQQYADQRLVALLDGGTTIQCLFLDPSGRHIAQREREEGYPAGRLSSLTQLNVDILKRLRAQLDDPAQRRFEIAVCDEAPHFNLLLVDDRHCVFQPYMPSTRGIDSPTFLIRDAADQDADGLLPGFARVYSWLWERRRSC